MTVEAPGRPQIDPLFINDPVKLLLSVYYILGTEWSPTKVGGRHGNKWHEWHVWGWGRAGYDRAGEAGCSGRAAPRGRVRSSGPLHLFAHHIRVILSKTSPQEPPSPHPNPGRRDSGWLVLGLWGRGGAAFLEGLCWGSQPSSISIFMHRIVNFRGQPLLITSMPGALWGHCPLHPQ